VESVQPIVAGAHAEYMTAALPSSANGAISMEAIRSGRFAAAMARKTVLALGPGLGTEEETIQFVHNVVANAEAPVVLDADGLNAFAGKGDQLARRKTPHLVVTPHPGEMARLVGLATADVQKDRVSCAKNAAREWNAWVVLKGFHTVLASPSGEVFVNTTGDAGLAKGGSGDVLTGLLAALIAQFGTKDLLRVVVLGTYLHGAAAELLSLQSDPSGILAGEVADAIPYARRKLTEELQARA
jgi:ADP-dependent NAD(P)H-hydrate dehydratase / NAD(P)H-hydrate epimerase